MKSLNCSFLIVAWALAVAVPALANENSLAVHVDCYPSSIDCIEIPFATESEGTVRAKREPEITISQGDLNQAELVTGEFGQKALRVSLKNGPAEKFAQITGGNIGKRLVIVADGKALVAPTIQAAITGGNFLLSPATGSEDKYLDTVPWLKKMAEDNKISEQRWGLFSMISYLLLGALILGGAVFFAFFRKKISVEPSA